jgi:hypothetical protein
MIARSKGKIAEIGLQTIQIDQDLRTEVGKDLIETRSNSLNWPNARPRQSIRLTASTSVHLSRAAFTNSACIRLASRSPR